MRLTGSIFLMACAAFAAQMAQADLRTMGADYRTMLSNFHMVAEIRKRCPEVEMPSLEPRARVEKMLQDKLGMDLYVETMIKLQKSNLRKDSISTIDKLWKKIDGCEDEQLGRALDRIAGVHAESYARFAKEPALVKPKPVPVPLRR